MKLRLQQALDAAGMSQRELARRLGHAHQWVDQLVEQRSCTLRTVTRLAAAMGVAEQELVEFER